MNTLTFHLQDETTKIVGADSIPLSLSVDQFGFTVKDSNANFVAYFEYSTVKWVESNLQAGINK